MSRVVIIDDAFIARLHIKNIMEEDGHQIVGEASDGHDGVAVCSKIKPELVTLDISMPKMDGIETLKLLLQEDKEIKVIMVSAVGQKQLIIEALDIGAKDFVTKPFEEDALRKALDRVLP